MRFIYFLKDNYIRITLTLLACIAVYLSISGYNTRFERLNTYLESINSDSVITMKVVSYPTFKDGKSKMVCEVTGYSIKQLEGSRTRLTLNNPSGRKINFHDELKFTGRLTSADESKMPGAFSYRDYLKSINVVSQCYADAGKISVNPSEGGFFTCIYNIRKSYLHSVDKYFEPQYGALVKAVITGDRTDIDEDSENSLKKAGVYHIVAISGLHLNIFILYITVLFSKLKTRKRLKNILTYCTCMICAMFVLVFTGYGVSVLRALSMLAVLFAANILSRDYDTKNALVVSGFIILIFAPYNFYSSAFYLSFLSTFGVLISLDIAKYLKERKILGDGMLSSFMSVVITSVVTTISTLPVTIPSFGYIPIYSWLANFLILPVMMPFLASCIVFAVMSGTGIEPLIRISAYVTHSLSAFIAGSADFVASLPHASADVYPGDVICVIIFSAVLIGAAFLAKKYGKLRASCVFLIFSVAFTVVLKYNSVDDTIKVNFVNIGQGDCALIELSDGKNVMIDCGEQNDDQYTQSNIDSYLRLKNIKNIHTAFISHFHADHTNGLVHMIADGRIRNLILPAYTDPLDTESQDIYKEMIECALRSGTEIYYMHSGTEICISDTEFKILAPDNTMFYGPNDMSAIIKMSYGANDFLFTGDIEKNGIINCMDKDISCDVIKVPHHGSKTGAIEKFYKKSNPDYAVISCGKDNLYGHPGDKVLKILDKNNIEYYRTDTNGVITFIADKKQITDIKTMR